MRIEQYFEEVLPGREIARCKARVLPLGWTVETLIVLLNKTLESVDALEDGNDRKTLERGARQQGAAHNWQRSRKLKVLAGSAICRVQLESMMSFHNEAGAVEV
jgi:hypothetical protein